GVPVVSRLSRPKKKQSNRPIAAILFHERHKLPMKTYIVSNNPRSSIAFIAALVLLPACLLLAQATPPLTQPGKYPGRAITGEVVKQGTVNMAEVASAPAERAGKTGTEIHPNRRPLLRPLLRRSGAAT